MKYNTLIRKLMLVGMICFLATLCSWINSFAGQPVVQEEDSLPVHRATIIDGKFSIDTSETISYLTFDSFDKSDTLPAIVLISTDHFGFCQTVKGYIVKRYVVEGFLNQNKQEFDSTIIIWDYRELPNISKK